MNHTTLSKLVAGSVVGVYTAINHLSMGGLVAHAVALGAIAFGAVFGLFSIIFWIGDQASKHKPEQPYDPDMEDLL